MPWLAAALVLGVGCGGAAPSFPGPTFKGANNYATLRGATVGQGGTSVFPLRKTITVKATGADSVLNIVDGQLVRTDDASETGYLIIRVKNVGSIPRCFIQARDVQWKNPVGAVLATNRFSYVHGSTGRFSTVFSDTCLAPGEVGAITGIQISSSSSSFYSPVSEIDLTWDVSNSSPFDDPPAKLIPTQYAVAGFAVTLTFANQGSAGAMANATLPFFAIALDADTPVAWFYGSDNLSPASGVVAASATGSASGDLVTRASGDGVWAFTNFDVCGDCLVSHPVGSRDEVQRGLLATWNEQQAELQRQLER